MTREAWDSALFFKQDESAENIRILEETHLEIMNEFKTEEVLNA
jgi:hypothetical protein